MLAGFVLLGPGGRHLPAERDPRRPARRHPVTVGLVLVLLGAFTKSAQYPFHSWLPGAMVAPTPVSAYLHSATMVKAGVYLIARLAPAFAGIGLWRPLVVAVGLVTMLGGGLRALRQHDLKLLLAFGTVSQLGFMVVVFGLGHRRGGRRRLRPAARPRRCSRRRCSWSSASSTTRPAPATSACCPAGPGWGPTLVGGRRQRRVDGRRPPAVRVHRQGGRLRGARPGSVGGRRWCSPIVAGSVLTVAYSLRFAGAARRCRRARHDGRPPPHAASGDLAGHRLRPLLAPVAAPGVSPPGAVVASRCVRAVLR